MIVQYPLKCTQKIANRARIYLRKIRDTDTYWHSCGPATLDQIICSHNLGETSPRTSFLEPNIRARGSSSVAATLVTMTNQIGPPRSRGRVTSSSRIAVGLVLVAASFFRASAQGDVGFGQSTVACPNAPGLTGYNTLEALNSDMSAELEKIRLGEPAQEPYMFELCPNTIFDASAFPLIPLLSGSVFMCGSAAAPGTSCDFVGGQTQVLIEDPVNTPGYELAMVSFVGVSFLGFEGAAISGSAGSNTTVDFLNTLFAVSTASSIASRLLLLLFHVEINSELTASILLLALQDFNEMFAVAQQHPGGLKPFTVQVVDSQISNGFGGAAFLNVGGELSLEGVTVDSSALATVVSTGTATGSGEGSTFLRSVTVTTSDIVVRNKSRAWNGCDCP